MNDGNRWVTKCDERDMKREEDVVNGLLMWWARHGKRRRWITAKSSYHEDEGHLHCWGIEVHLDDLQELILPHPKLYTCHRSITEICYIFLQKRIALQVESYISVTKDRANNYCTSSCEIFCSQVHKIVSWLGGSLDFFSLSLILWSSSWICKVWKFQTRESRNI